MGKKEIKIPKNQLKNLYENHNFSIPDLAKIYACGETPIQRKLHKHKIQVRPSMSIKLHIPKNRLRFLYEEEKKTSGQLAKIYSCSFSTILNRLKEYQIKIRDISEAHIKYPKKNFSGNPIEKSYLIGFRLGDLHVKKYEKKGEIISVECASIHQQQITLIHNLFKKYGYVRIKPAKRKKLIRIQCALNPSFYFLLNKEDKVEPWILSNDNLFFAFLGGYLDAEGDIGIYSKNAASLRIGTYGKNILSQIREKLLDKGIDSRLTLDKPKGSKVNLPREDKIRYANKNYRTSQDFWRLAVYRKKDLLTLFNRIAPYLRHHRMKEGLLEARRNIIGRNQKFGNLRMN